MRICPHGRRGAAVPLGRHIPGRRSRERQWGLATWASPCLAPTKIPASGRKEQFSTGSPSYQGVGETPQIPGPQCRPRAHLPPHGRLRGWQSLACCVNSFLLNTILLLLID